MAQVVLNDVKKVYDGDVVAVHDANLDILDKEFMVIVGPSGCGKTTTLRMIAGLEDITDGTVSIAGKVVNDLAPKNRDVAMVFQNYALYPHMTVFQNMAFGLKLRKFPKAQIKERVENAARMLGIESYLKRKPKALSGGQRQRVALGRAIVRDPAAFLFDEPLSNLDAKLRVTTRAELKALHHRLQTTSIYVTHDQAEAMTLGDRICVMYEGKIQQVAPPMDVYDKPVNKFVAGFLGTPPMNFFEGKVRFEGETPLFAVDEQTKIGLGSMADTLKPYQNKEMTLGIRPENMTLEPPADQSNNSIQAKVKVVEPLGDRKDVYFETLDGRTFIANLSPHVQIKPGQVLDVFIDIQKAHIFEPGDTGKNIGY